MCSEMVAAGQRGLGEARSVIVDCGMRSLFAWSNLKDVLDEVNVACLWFTLGFLLGCTKVK